MSRQAFWALHQVWRCSFAQSRAALLHIGHCLWKIHQAGDTMRLWAPCTKIAIKEQLLWSACLIQWRKIKSSSSDAIASSKMMQIVAVCHCLHGAGGMQKHIRSSQQRLARPAAEWLEDQAAEASEGIAGRVWLAEEGQGWDWETSSIFEEKAGRCTYQSIREIEEVERSQKCSSIRCHSQHDKEFPVLQSQGFIRPCSSSDPACWGEDDKICWCCGEFLIDLMSVSHRFYFSVS